VQALSPLALALVLVAACLHACWNLLLHETADRVAAVAVAGLATAVVLLPFIVAQAPWRVLPLVLISAAAEAAYALLLSAAYARGALAVAYPIARGTAPLLVTLGAWLVLAQRPGALAVVGAVMLAFGLMLVSTAGHRAGELAAVSFALLTGVAIASYSVVDARAVRSVATVGYLGMVSGLWGLLLLGWMRGEGGVAEGVVRLRKTLRPGLLIAVGSATAYLLVLFAFQLAPAGRVSTLREVSVLLGVLLSRSRRGWQVWVGAALVFAGMVLAAV
jgi:drug/metabolite transporter (DMT)-like permease